MPSIPSRTVESTRSSASGHGSRRPEELHQAHRVDIPVGHHTGEQLPLSSIEHHQTIETILLLFAD
jgi:hypothetical protein